MKKGTLHRGGKEPILSGNMIRPFRRDAELLKELREAGNDPHALGAWWLGQSGFLVQWSGHRLLLDPYLSDSLTAKYAGTDKPHVRMTERVVAPDMLEDIDLVTSSHNHTDHLDAETLGPIFKKNPGADLVIPEANRNFVAGRLGVKPGWPRGLVAGQSFVRHPWTIHAVPAAHESLEVDGDLRHRFLGYVLEAGPWFIYHSGDTVLYDGQVEWLKKWRIDLALLPINGRCPERRVAGNLSGAEAARLAKEIGARWVIPCHYEMFEFNTASPREFIETCERIDQPFAILRAGQAVKLKATGSEKRLEIQDDH